MNKIPFLLASCMLYTTLASFSSLREAQLYASQHPEDVVPQNKDEFIPSFRDFYRQTLPSFWDKIFMDVGINKRTQPFDYQSFKNNLSRLLTERELIGEVEKHVSLLPTPPNDRIIIFGDIQGGFHSLVRDLAELVEMGIIDENFRMKAFDCCIVFNANLIGRTPYNLETLSLVVALLHRNPHNVFYVRGKYEDKDYWLEANLGKQLDYIDELQLENKNSLASLLIRFFSTLPLAMYVDYPVAQELIRISGFDTSFYEINEKMMGNFFEQPKQSLERTYRIGNKVPVEKPVHLRVLVKSMDGVSHYIKNDGLVMTEPQAGATTWSVFSSPTRFQRLINNFYLDAFAIIHLGTTALSSTITTYNRDSRTTEPFVKREEYMLVAGDQVNKVESTEQPKTFIKVGSSMDLTKSASSMGKDIREGIVACLNTYNPDVALNKGRNLRVIILDDYYTPVKARQAVDYFMKEEHIDIVILPLGTPTLQASLDLLKTNKITVLFPITGASLFRDPSVPGVINLRASYTDEVRVLIPFIIKKYFVKNFTFLYQNDSYGIGAMQEARKVLKNKGITTWLELPYNRNTTDFTDIVKKIKDIQPDALGLFSASASTREVLRQLGVEPLVGTQVFGLSFLMDEAFETYIKQLGLRYVFARSVPSPHASTLPITVEYRKVMRENHLQPNAYSLEAYIGTNLLFHAMQNIQGPINHESVKVYFEGIKNYDFKGLSLNFDPQTRQLLSSLWLDEGEKEWTKINIKDEEQEPQETPAPSVQELT